MITVAPYIIDVLRRQRKRQVRECARARAAWSTTQEERIQIAKECLESGKNYGEMALKYNVSYQQARTWTLRFEEIGEAGLDDAERGRRTRRRGLNWNDCKLKTNS